jgi:3-phosphoshikimate 1-carboxyvinyltransferase
MTEMQPKIQPLISRKASGLKGRIKVPGDKSMSHRALMLGAVAIGETRIRGLLEAEDVVNTAKAMAALGAKTFRDDEGVWHVQGVGVAGLNHPIRPLISAIPARACASPLASWPQLP